jgi:hypothetical protein
VDLGAHKSDVSNRVAQYYDFLWSTSQFYNRDAFLTELSPALRSEIRLHLDGDMVRRVKIFQSFNNVALIDIVNSLFTRLYLSGYDKGGYDKEGAGGGGHAASWHED